MYPKTLCHSFSVYQSLSHSLSVSMSQFIGFLVSVSHSLRLGLSVSFGHLVSQSLTQSQHLGLKASISPLSFSVSISVLWSWCLGLSLSVSVCRSHSIILLVDSDWRKSSLINYRVSVLFISVLLFLIDFQHFYVTRLVIL